MRPTLFYLPTEICGFPVFGTGVLFWAILLAGAFSIIRALVKRAAIGDCVFYAILTAIGLGLAKVVGPRICEPEGFPIRGYGVFLTLALVLTTLLTIWRGKKLWNYPADQILGAVFVCAFFGLIGARVFYVAEYWDDFEGESRLLDIINITNGGLVVYGSMIGGAIALVLYLWLKKTPVMATLDLFMPALMLGVAIGRLGCLMNGCCFGGVCDKPWAVVFPKNSPAYLRQIQEGTISLYGLRFESPAIDDEEASTELFSLKGKSSSVISSTPSPIIVSQVDEGSEAERAGIKPGMRILRVGLVPRGLSASELPTLDKEKRSQTQFYAAASTAQLYSFFLDLWNDDPERDVCMRVEERDGDARTTRDFVYHPCASTTKPVHPTQLYSSLSALTICVLLLIVARFVRRDGIVFSLGVTLYPINRFVLELLRTDETSFLGTGLTVSQCVSLCVFAVGIVLLLYYGLSRPRRALAGFFPPTSEEVDASADAKGETRSSNEKRAE